MTKSLKDKVWKRLIRMVENHPSIPLPSFQPIPDSLIWLVMFLLLLVVGICLRGVVSLCRTSWFSRSKVDFLSLICPFRFIRFITGLPESQSSDYSLCLFKYISVECSADNIISRQWVLRSEPTAAVWVAERADPSGVCGLPGGSCLSLTLSLSFLPSYLLFLLYCLCLLWINSATNTHIYDYMNFAA